jgi:hypothetical protein
VDGPQIAQLVTALCTLLAALAAYVKSRSSEKKTDDVHVLVNGRYSALTAKVDDLYGMVTGTSPASSPLPADVAAALETIVRHVAATATLPQPLAPIDLVTPATSPAPASSSVGGSDDT